MGAENEKATKNRCFRARNSYGGSAVWCGNGCQRFLIGAPAGRADFGRKTKRAGLERGAFLAFLPTLFLKFGPTWAILGIKRGKFAPKMAKFPPKGARKGVKIAQIGPNFKIAQI